jgi:hypothetical protein
MRWHLSYEDVEAVEMAYKAARLRESAASAIVVGVIDDFRRNGWWTVLSISEDHATARIVVGTVVGITPTSETVTFNPCDQMLTRVSALAAHAEIHTPQAKAVEQGKTSLILEPKYIVAIQGVILTSHGDSALANYAEAVLTTADICLAAESTTQ